ncbi:MAG: hypothetical protein J7513_12215 [Solirubrobacteraceae bacterium]|nr:hypothetical protein [Solirubrobacteraceae bacterium]
MNRSAPLPPSLVAALSLVVGFAVADITGVRPLGGVVLLAGGAWCAIRWNAARGTTVTVVLGVLYVFLFIFSHVLGDLIGTWPAVFTVAAVMGLAGWLAADRGTPPHTIDIV